MSAESEDAYVAQRLDAEDGATSHRLRGAEERAFHAEKRHLFWRNRCLEHARRIDALDRRCVELERALAGAQIALGPFGDDA